MPDVTRWAEEASFFDKLTADEAIRPVSEFTFARYSIWLRRRFPEELKFRVLGNVAGKRILDVGCGDGINSVILAKLGATVTGVDLSPQSIAAARKRARVNAVEASFVCSPLETACFAPRSFDAIWCDAFLHHVPDSLQAVFSRLTSWCKPNAEFMICEPVNLWPPLRNLRLAVFPPPKGTSNERPLERDELTSLQRYLTDTQTFYFRGLGRIEKVVLPYGLEAAGPLRRSFASLILALDVRLLSLPVVRNVAGRVVIYGHAQ
jgi:SAM-dependent methyltransferase